MKIICKESSMVSFRALLPAHLQVCMGAPWTGATLGWQVRNRLKTREGSEGHISSIHRCYPGGFWTRNGQYAKMRSSDNKAECVKMHVPHMKTDFPSTARGSSSQSHSSWNPPLSSCPRPFYHLTQLYFWIIIADTQNDAQDTLQCSAIFPKSKRGHTMPSIGGMGGVNLCFIIIIWGSMIALLIILLYSLEYPTP